MSCKSFAALSTAVGFVLCGSCNFASSAPAGTYIPPHAGNAVTSPLQPDNTKTVMIGGDIATALTPQSVYKVPSGYSLSLTDIVIVDYNNVDCDVVFGNGPDYVTSEIRVAANAMASENLHTGLFFNGGQSIYMVTDERLPGDGACTPTFTLIGTLTKKP